MAGYVSDIARAKIFHAPMLDILRVSIRVRAYVMERSWTNRLKSHRRRRDTQTLEPE
jgi:hypothetical protein